jgi:hypothetical protein
MANDKKTKKKIYKKKAAKKSSSDQKGFSLESIITKGDRHDVAAKTDRAKASPKNTKKKVINEESVFLKQVEKMKKSKNFEIIHSSSTENRERDKEKERLEFVVRHKSLKGLANSEREVMIYLNFPRVTKGIGARITPVFNYSPIGDPSGNVMISNHYSTVVPHSHCRSGSSVDIESYVHRAIENGKAITEIEKILKKTKVNSEEEAIVIIRRFMACRLEKSLIAYGDEVDIDKVDVTQFFTMFPGLEIKSNLQSILVNSSLNTNSKEKFLSFEYPRVRNGEKGTARILHPINNVVRNIDMMERIANIWDDCFADYHLKRADFREGVGKIY